MRKLTTVISDFRKCVKNSRELADDAYNWSIPAASSPRPRITAKRRDAIVELAFFRALNGWESFLEETFILYMLGQQAPRGRKARRYGFPPTEEAAYDWVADGRDYAKWTHADVVKRAERLFTGGRPFTPVLQKQPNLFKQAKTIRNALAHDSRSAQQKFEALIRDQLGALPPNMTVGSFLLSTKPKSAPPISFLEFYLGEIEKAAQEIVPT